MRRWPARSESPVPNWLAGTSLLLCLVVLAEVGVRVLGYADWLTAEPAPVTGNFSVGVLTALPFVAGIGYAGHWLAASDLRPERFHRVWRWTVVGGGLSLLLNLALMAVVPVPTVYLAVGWLRWAVALGCGVGVAIGVTEARAINSALDAERSAVRAEHLAVQRDLLDYLNSLLRHEILNAANVISGYASLLADEHEEGTDAREYSENVHRKSEEITTVIADVRVLLRATEGHGEFESVNLSAVLREEVGKLADLDERVEVETDVPDGVYVSADALLPRVFGNLLGNAVEHNDSAPPRVSVRVEDGDDTVAVEVADNGRGIPESEVETLFDRPSQRSADHGLGLYLVGKLVQHYGGTVELTETGPDGTTFRVELPAETREDGGVDVVDERLPFGDPSG